ncbi:MAG: Sulfhydrogenase 2 subunit beta [Candidatus Heimdallarchaeota archaeon AB_125]|nr:MAG: Sulfhydrogenase 2 subunit beta [Candidatus Heimdallarchaeota archaeon AB_125]
MENLVIQTEKLSEWVNEVIKKNKVFAPVKETDFSNFKIIDDYSEIDFTYLLPRVPAKKILFKQTETLFLFTPGSKGSVQTKEISDEKLVVFSLRTCDAKTFSILDPVFLGDYADPFYKSRRERSILIGLSCNKPNVNCFCTSFGDSPASSDYVDILLTDLDGKHLVEVVTERGKKFIDNYKKFFTSASKEDLDSKKKVEEQAIKGITRTMKLEGIPEKLDKMFEHPIWYENAMKCIGCGTCTFVCPTCHCFDMQDESTLREGARVRVWDYCMNPEYTHHASGHNPRPARMNRVRNRIFHKFNYYPINDNIVGCTGCGRCIDYCSVNIDVIDIINKIGEAES